MRHNKITIEILKILEDLESCLGLEKEEIVRIGNAHRSFEGYINFNLLKGE